MNRAHFYTTISLKFYACISAYNYGTKTNMTLNPITEITINKPASMPSTKLLSKFLDSFTLKINARTILSRISSDSELPLPQGEGLPS